MIKGLGFQVQGFRFRVRDFANRRGLVYQGRTKLENPGPLIINPEPWTLDPQPYTLHGALNP
jgi:hypothetical protein